MDRCVIRYSKYALNAPPYKTTPCGWFLYGEYRQLERVRSWFDYKRKPDGSMAVAKGDERSGRSVSEVVHQRPP